MSNTSLLKSERIIAVGALFALISVAAGAFGAHGLKDSLTDYQLSVFNTGVEYQTMHALGLIFIGILKQQFPSHRLDIATILMIVGILLFSGSLYTLSLTGIKWLGMVTPFGGVCFLLSWLMICFSFIRRTEN